MAASRVSCNCCCGWLCGLCCCCCGLRGKRETSPLLSSGVGVGGAMSRRVTASPDGQSETQTVEVKVRSHEEDEEVIGKASPDKEKRRSREVSPRDPATSTTFVRGSSGRSSWRMVPNSKRQSGSPQETGQKTDNTVVSQETEVSEVKIELVSTATETPPLPPKDYRLTQTFEEQESEPDDEGEGEGEKEIVHTSSFSFAARDGQLIDTHYIIT